MAERVVRNVEEDYLMCSICLGRYTEPKLLPCGHTFCKRCLTEHVKQTVPGSTCNNFKCPNDRQQISRPSPGPLNPKDWADKFPTDTFISNLLTAVRIHEGGSPPEDDTAQTDVSVNSAPASSPRRSVPRRNIRQNSVQNEMQRTVEMSRYSHLRGPACEEHPEREQGFFCLGCSMLVCPNCAVRSHRRRTCDCVPIAEAMTRLQPKIQGLRTKFAGQMERIQQVHQNSQPDGGVLQAAKTRSLNTLNEMESRLGRFYENILQQIEDSRRQINEAVPASVLENPMSERIMNGVRSTQSLLENQAENNEIDILKDLQQMDNQAKEYDTAIQSLERNISAFKVEFTPKPAFENFIRNQQSIGTVKIGNGTNSTSGRQITNGTNNTPGRQMTNGSISNGSQNRQENTRSNTMENSVRPTQTPRPNRQPPARSRPVQRITRVNCKDPTQDVNSWKLTGIAFVGTTAVIADSLNHMIRQVSLNGSVALNQVLPLDHAQSVCNTDVETEVAVTQPEKRQLSIIAADRRGGLRVKDIVRTLKSYEEIAFLPADRFVVSSLIGRMSIDVIDQAGHVLKSLERSYQFRTPRFLSVTSTNKIVVSDRDLKELVCINLDGSTDWTISTQNSFPCGVSCDFTGKIYLCLDNNTVVVLSEDGSLLPNKLVEMGDGLKTPYAICARRRQVAVTELGSSLFAPGSPWLFVINSS
ncbi:hypothetical protein FSP39_019329 [Pinctada imbricata]|uniref:Uncharacterized protein n=1 Tax=Pinctada imbricata TaxID=66713 RepID=A0AA89BXP1_PINIB|nr:hypothetical protein FSP39_019329 [Pinctada imbricata]